jgi:hypothetical protein
MGMKKNIILTISFFGSLTSLVAKNSAKLQICDKSDYSCRTNWDTLELILYFFVPVLLFSLITYFAPERVFAAWWKFARIAIPSIFVAVLLINLELHHGPQVRMPELFDIPALVLLYSIFIIGSVWQIWKGWRSA